MFPLGFPIFFPHVHGFSLGSPYFSWFHPRVEKPRCIFASSAKMAVSITGAMKPVCRDSSDGTIHGYIIIDNIYIYTWWLIPLSKWVITPVINGISRVNPLIIGVITHLLSGMNHQVWKPWPLLRSPQLRPCLDAIALALVSQLGLGWNDDVLDL